MVIVEPAQRSLSCTTSFVLGIILAVLAVTALAGGQDYRLYAGDSVSVSVSSRPDLSGTFYLDEQGQLTFPLIGPLNGNGRTTEEIRASIADRLKKHIDGDVEVAVTLYALGGTAGPVGFQPVYIDGDVVQPGAYPYRAGMTVTMAVALAGGRHSVRSSGTLLGLSQEQEQFELLLDTHRANIAHEARLLAELSGKEDVVFPADLEAAANSSARVREILKNERAIMQSQATLQAQHVDSIERSIKGLEQEVSELESQKSSINTRRRLYEKKFKDIESLTKKGVLPKSTLLSLQITATSLDQEARTADISIIRSRQKLDESRAQLANLPAEREAEITAALQKVQDSLTQTRIQFDQSLRRLAVLKSQTPPEAEPGFMEPPPRVSISRIAETVAKPPAKIKAGWDSPVLPGDVIWIPYPEFTAQDAFNGSLPGRYIPLSAHPDQAPSSGADQSLTGFPAAAMGAGSEVTTSGTATHPAITTSKPEPTPEMNDEALSAQASGVKTVAMPADTTTIIEPEATTTAEPDSTAGTLAEVANKKQGRDTQADAIEKPPGDSEEPDTPWVINLTSTQNKADAERFTVKAKSGNIATTMQPVTVKGTQYWRVQITGFSTRAEANTYARTIQEKLDLKDFWITKR